MCVCVFIYLKGLYNVFTYSGVHNLSNFSFVASFLDLSSILPQAPFLYHFTSGIQVVFYLLLFSSSSHSRPCHNLFW